MKTNKKISNKDLEWLHAHKQSVERRARLLKSAGIFFYYFVIYLVAPIAFGFALLSTIVAVEWIGVIWSHILRKIACCGVCFIYGLSIEVA